MSDEVNNKKYLKVTYFDNHRNIGNLFFPLKNSQGKEMEDEVDLIIGKIVDDGFVWVTDSKIIPEHRIFVYEVCNEEVKKKVESYRPRYNNNYNRNDNRNDGRRDNYQNNYRNNYRNDKNGYREDRSGYYNRNSQEDEAGNHYNNDDK
jgi:hypothetical protein